MTGKDIISKILDHESADRAGFWVGNPQEETKEIYCKGLGLPYLPPVDVEPGKWEEAQSAALKKSKADVDLAAALGSDLFWCSPEHMTAAWRHPKGKPIFDCYGGEERRSLGQPGVFAEVLLARQRRGRQVQDVRRGRLSGRRGGRQGPPPAGGRLVRSVTSWWKPPRQRELRCGEALAQASEGGRGLGHDQCHALHDQDAARALPGGAVPRLRRA